MWSSVLLRLTPAWFCLLFVLVLLSFVVIYQNCTFVLFYLGTCYITRYIDCN